MLKTAGYVVSTLSVVLLAIVAWEGAKPEPRLQALLIAGAAASIVGMLLRWLAFRREQAEKAMAANLQASPLPRAAASRAASGGD